MQQETDFKTAAPSVFWRKYGAGILDRVAPEVCERDVKFRALRSGQITLSGWFEAADQSFFVKHYDPKSRSSKKPYLVEREALRFLGPAQLSPKLRAFSDENLILVQDFVPGVKVRELLDTRSLPNHCNSAGRWLRMYSDKAPHFAKPGNWRQYLENYPDLFASDAMSQFGEFLRTMTIEQHVLSRNSGMLDDLVLRPDGSIFATKFNRAQFKPFGWDLLLTARSFCQLFPEKSELITDQLAAGFCRGSKDATARYASLLRVFALGHVFETGRDVSPSPAMMGLEAFNKDSDDRAELAATAP